VETFWIVGLQINALRSHPPLNHEISVSGSGHKFDDVSPPYAHRIPTLDNIVIYGGDTVGIRRDYGQAPYVMELMLVTTKVGRRGA
jgi:hypothetical protein